MRTSVGAAETPHCGQTSRRHSAHIRVIVATWPQTEQRRDDSDAGRVAAAAAADDGGAAGRG